MPQIWTQVCCTREANLQTHVLHFACSSNMPITIVVQQELHCPRNSHKKKSHLLCMKYCILCHCTSRLLWREVLIYSQRKNRSRMMSELFHEQSRCEYEVFDAAGSRKISRSSEQSKPFLLRLKLLNVSSTRFVGSAVDTEVLHFMLFK